MVIEMMLVIQDTLLGHIIRFVSRRRILRHPEECPPPAWNSEDLVDWYSDEDAEVSQFISCGRIY
jgi:hypothetical protein